MVAGDTCKGRGGTLCEVGYLNGLGLLGEINDNQNVSWFGLLNCCSVYRGFFYMGISRCTMVILKCIEYSEHPQISCCSDNQMIRAVGRL